MCFGLAAGQWVLQHRAAGLQRCSEVLRKGALGAPLRGLAWLGRWSLSYYMLHQPVLIGVFSLLALLR
jgi:peptidoglycan/LPS O-acetylase OafA/YrhL